MINLKPFSIISKIKNNTNIFPRAEIKNIRLFYVLTIFNNTWFIAGNWIFFWTRFMSYRQLGWVDGTAFAFGLLMEIPSGAISDLIGKRKTIIAAMFFLSSSVISLSLTSSLGMLWVSWMFTQLGWALYSGAAEALAYDTLVEYNQEKSYEKVISFSSSAASVTSILGTLAGGLLYAIHFRLSHLAWGIFYLFGFIVSLKLREPKIDTEKFSFSGYAKQISDGIRQLIKPAIRPFLIIILMLMGSEYLYNWGLVKPATATHFGFGDQQLAIILAVFGIINAILAQLIPFFRKKISDKKGLYFLAIVMGAGYILTYFDLGYLGVLPMFIIAASGYLAYPWISIVVNREIPSKFRATTLSTVALITRIPYVVLAIIAGSMLEQGRINVFNFILGAAIILSILVSSAEYAKQKLTNKR